MRRRNQPKMPPPPSIDRAIDAVMPDAERSLLPLRPYARYISGIGWIVESITEMTVTYNGHPSFEEPMARYDVTVMPMAYYR